MMVMGVQQLDTLKKSLFKQAYNNEKNMGTVKNHFHRIYLVLIKKNVRA